MFCGRSSMVEHQLPKLNTRVRFPSPAPRRGEPLWFAAFFCAKCGFTVRVGLTCRFGRCWTRPTGAQHRSSPRKVTLGSAARLQAPSLTPHCRYQLFAVEGHCSLGIYFVTPTQRQAAAPKSRISLCGVRDFCCPRLRVK